MSKINKKELHEIFQDMKNKDKNQSAYNKLYEKYYNLIYGIVFSIVKNKVDSEDVTHEIFTKIYKLDVNKLPIDHEASWLFTVSKNECLLFFRKSKPNISIDEIYEMPNVSNEIDSVIDKEYYNKLMSGLKEDEKMIVSLKVLSNFTFNKISQVMGIPIGTVQWKYYNAINSLKISIGSLVGAVLAFIVVIARGEFWKKKEYINNSENGEFENKYDENLSNDISDNKNMEAAQSEDSNSKINQNEDDSLVESNENKASNIDTSNQNTKVETDEVTQIADNSNSLMNGVDKIQIGFLSIGIAFFIIFIIFFKIYQQKLKKKSSK